MLSPNPISLLCAVLLCLPLALIFSTTTTTLRTALITTLRPDATVLLPSSINRRYLKPTFELNEDPQISLKGSPIPRKSNPISAAAPPIAPDDGDEPLLRAASRANQHPPRGSRRKIAFMFLTTAPLPFAPLWELFFNQTRPYYNIYIHADPSFSYEPPFSGVFTGRVIPTSKPTRRNSPSLVSAARRLLAHALLHDAANSMFVLLSGSCVPLHSFRFTYGKLAGSGKSFIEVLSNETGAYGRWAARGEDAMLPEVGLDDFRIGSQFWALTRKHARVVVRDRRLWRKFKLPCVRLDTCYPEENYFPTLLSMVDPRGVVPATLTHVDWYGSYDGHPRTYNSSQVGPGLIQRLRGERPRYGDLGINGSDWSVMVRRDSFLFARKFEADCLGPLLSIAHDVILRD